MVRPLVADTTAIVQAIRQAHQPFFDAVLRGQIWLTAVVACELYAGTRSAEEARLLDRLVRGATVRERMIVPSAEDWAAAGQLLARRARLSGALHPRHRLAEVLIVVSTALVMGEIVTASRTYFEAWADLARRSGLDVIVCASDLWLEMA